MNRMYLLCVITDMVLQSFYRQNKQKSFIYVSKSWLSAIFNLLAFQLRGKDLKFESPCLQFYTYAPDSLTYAVKAFLILHKSKN